ncbi:TetR/AcrR family transcriptional regulator [Streptomyces sp. SBT349]|uniref:TetR/AcrR family transcriptional regulator n=1 Tax=Streptomyces sp. SBT349 TaxID=1580539 RepID=UPI00066E4A91|nr:TetR/AcrR family transcriptional regulator [Streptomyces sp. SBT349]
MGDDSTPLGPRERKKRRTNDDLLRCGIGLFLDRGIERTTVGEIVREAEVSERTFFRYFASKEELFLQPLRAAARLLVEEVARRPAEEEPLRALREAGLASLRGLGRGGAERYLSAMRLVSTEPVAMAACQGISTEQQRRLAVVLSEREGLRPGDPRPALLVGACTAAGMQATAAWEGQQDGSMESLMRITLDHLGMLRPALAGDWREGPARKMI